MEVKLQDDLQLKEAGQFKCHISLLPVWRSNSVFLFIPFLHLFIPFIEVITQFVSFYYFLPQKPELYTTAKQENTPAKKNLPSEVLFFKFKYFQAVW